jgi:hypothetical protein
MSASGTVNLNKEGNLEIDAELEDIINRNKDADKLNVQSLPLRAYLDNTVIPVVVEGLKCLAKVLWAYCRKDHQTLLNGWRYIY